MDSVLSLVDPPAVGFVCLLVLDLPPLLPLLVLFADCISRFTLRVLLNALYLVVVSNTNASVKHPQNKWISSLKPIFGIHKTFVVYLYVGIFLLELFFQLC